MANWKDFPLPDGSYADDTRPWSQQDVVNYLPVPAEKSGTRSALKLATCPGLRQFARVGTGPFRGTRDVEGKFFAVSGRTLYQVPVTGTATNRGTIPGTGLVSLTHNQIAGGNEVLIGTFDNSYLWNTVTETLAATGIPLFSVDFLNQRFLGIDPQRRFWRYSALADGTSWNALDNESAESSPDRIIGGKVCNGEWYVFGERTIEVWSNTPSSTTAFQRVQVIEKGCANANTIQRMFNTLFFVGDDGVPYMLAGYTPQAIAPKAIIKAIGAGDPRKLISHTWEDDGHAVYYITAQDGQTFGYDVTTQRWHRRESFEIDRWRVNTLTKWNGGWYAGDYRTDQLYVMERGYVYEGCEIMPRKLTTGVLHNNGNRVQVHGMQVSVATGGVPSVGACPATPPPPWLMTTTQSGQLVKVSPDGDDWSLAGTIPANATGTRLVYHGGYVVGTQVVDTKVARRSADGTWQAGIGIGTIDASSGDVLHTGTHWIVGKAGQWTLRSVDGLNYEDIPGPYNPDTQQQFKGECIAATATKVYGYAALGTTGWLFNINLDGTNQVRLPDPPTGYNMTSARMVSDGTAVCLVGYQDSGVMGLLKIVGTTYTALANPFPNFGLSADAPVVQYAMGRWFICVNNRVAIGTTLDNLALDQRVFPNSIRGIGSDGEKVIICGQNGMLEKWTPTGGWVALTSNITSDIKDVVALGVIE